MHAGSAAGRDRMSRAHWPGPRLGAGERFRELHLVFQDGAADLSLGRREAARNDRPARRRGKGGSHFALADGARCIDQEPIRNEPQDFTITGGTGAYEGASGSGTVERSVSAGLGTERWTGTLVVPGVEFDVTPPTLSGARSKTVQAPIGATRVRVTYNVTASDAVDGAVPVSCSPRSGSRFHMGRTVVACSATDTSANTRPAKFLITVKRRG
jgi:HYR domain